MGIRILPPDINTSGWDFSIEDQADCEPAIRFGLGAIKNVGQSSVEAILSARSETPFESLGDFARRVDLRSVGKRPLECIIKVGALDRFGSRASLLESATRIHGISSSHFRAKDTGQMSLFKPSTGSLTLPETNYIVSQREILNWEKELLGLYVSDHPLSPHMGDLHEIVTHFSGQLADAADKEPVRVAGIVVQVRPHLTRNGKSMAFVRLEDLQGSIELVVFPNTWKKYGSLIEEERVILALGKVDNEGGQPKVLVDMITDNLKIAIEDLPPLESLPTNGRRKNGSANGEPYSAGIEPLATPALPDSDLVEIDSVENGYEDGLPPPPDDIPEWDLEPVLGAGVHTPGEPSGNGKINEPSFGAYEPGKEKGKPEEVMVSSAPAEVTHGTSDLRPIPAATPPPLPEVARSGIPEKDAFNGSTGTNGTPTAKPVAAQPDRPAVTEAFPGVNQPYPAVSGGSVSKMVTVILRTSGDRMRDILLMRRIHGTLISYPGSDRFAFLMLESGRNYMLEFPNFTTGVCDLLVEKLNGLVGSENVRIEDY
jgi:DNA polymerase-3 subunit alpha